MCKQLTAKNTPETYLSITSDSATISLSLAFGKACSTSKLCALVYLEFMTKEKEYQLKQIKTIIFIKKHSSVTDDAIFHSSYFELKF